MVALDHDAFTAQAGLHHIGIDGALCQKIHSADLLGLLLEHADELLADDLALALRLGYARQLRQKTGTGVNAAHIHMELMLHHLLHLIALILAQQAVIYKDTGQLIAHGTLQKGSRHGAVHAAGQRQQHPSVADLTAALRHSLLQIGRHSPLRGKAADGIQEVLQDLGAVLRMQYLGMELHAVKLPIGTLHRRMAAAFGGGNDLKAGGHALDLHAVAHPVDRLFGHSIEQR